MLLSRYIPIIAPLALAGVAGGEAGRAGNGGIAARRQRHVRRSRLWAVIVILGLLMFMPVAVLGPIAEHLALR